jgi:hypothetical protein
MTDAQQIAEHDHFYPVRSDGEEPIEFLRRCLLEHRRSHETWIAPLRKQPNVTSAATSGAAYQERAVYRYDQMLAALDELSR